MKTTLFSWSRTRAAWLVACCVVLIWWSFAYGMSDTLSATLKNEAQVYLLIPMVVLSFPAGLLWVVVLAGVLRLASTIGLDTTWSPLVHAAFIWLGCVIFGYVQWFLVVPALVARRKRGAS